MADYAQSPYAGIDYYKSVVAKMGATNVENFLRLYVAPGVDHIGVGAPSSVDLLEVLTDWSENGTHYQGGDVTKAESFVCRGL